ncbi:MAG TPA: PP2C family protein-serine/threonine phosphatase [Thermoanaerobaculia bacterium]
MSRRERRKKPRSRGSRVERVGGFLREYTAGFNTRDLQRLFDRDAAQAYAVLTREHAREPEPRGRVSRMFFRTRLAFLGISYKLSPSRRLLFALAILLFVVGLLQDPLQFTAHGRTVSLEFSPLWFLGAMAIMAFLLALELVDRVRVRDELEVARELQADLLPQAAPQLAGWRFAHSYRTAVEVGGDYYDFTPLPDGRLALAVGDASGHGMAAGLVMAIANAVLKTALDLDPAPAAVAALLNRTLCRTGTRRTFLSLFYALLDPATGRLEYIGAGHPFPLLLRRDGTIEELGKGGLPLGLRQPLAPATGEATLAPGDILVLFTDGLVEATDPQGERAFGFERLSALVRPGGSPQTIHDRVLAAFDAHVGGEPLRDDLTLVVIGREPGAVAPASD